VVSFPSGERGRVAPARAKLDATSKHRNTFVVAALGITQIIGWGSVLFMPAVLGNSMQAELGMSTERTFGGVALMYTVAAIAAPSMGRLMDKLGAPVVMAAGSLAGGAGLTVLAHAQGSAVYLFAWLILGATCAAALTNAACVAVSQSMGHAAIRGMTALMFITGFAGTVSLPCVYLFEDWVGWRGTCLLLAAAHLAVCLPLHLALGHGQRLYPTTVSRGTDLALSRDGEWQRRAFHLLAAALGLNVLVTAGFSVHLVGVLRAAGYADAMAVLLASLVGLAQVAARAVQFLAIGRLPPPVFAVVGAVALPLALAIMLLSPVLSPFAQIAATTAFVIVLGLSNGLMMVARSTVPAHVFGLTNYGLWTGRLAAFQNAATALAPLVFAAVLQRSGVAETLLLAGIAALLSLAALLVLVRLEACADSD
jgi:predicted MFS family arabinose efflux permease